jgi:hypothetical protein
VLPWRAPSITYPNVRSFVSTLALAPKRLYLGGLFTDVGGKPRPSGVAALRLDTGGVTKFAPKFSADDVTSIAPAGRVVLIGGTFGGGAFDARTSDRVRGFVGVPGAATITVHGSAAYLGGNLRSSISEHNLLAVDLSTHRLTHWEPNLARYVIVERIAVSGAKVFVGGSFCSSIG